MAKEACVYGKRGLCSSETAAYSLDQHATYILLDGTWQEARNMFRKCPSLHSLPRVALPGNPQTLNPRL
jgi:DTW domain-containing protein YfiP